MTIPEPSRLEITSFGEAILSALDASFKAKEIIKIGKKSFCLSGVSRHWTGTEIGRVSAVAEEVYEASIKSKSWAGGGLPPIGTVCDFMSTQHEGPKFFEPVEVMYISNVTVVARRIEDKGGIKQEFLCHPSTAKFRPIRTPEQIAAEEKAKAIKEMQYLFGGGSSGTTHIFETLYNHGYRKQKDS